MASRFTIFKGGSWRINMRGWPFVIVIGLFLAVIAILDGGGLAGVRASSSTAVSCSFRTNAVDVNVRSDATASSPSVQKLALGETIKGSATVSNGFRQLADGRWVLDGYLTPVVGNTCA